MSEIAAAIAELQANLPAIVKGETAKVDTKGGGSYTYNYADLAELSAELLPLLANHGLSFVCCPTLRDDGQFVLDYRLLHKSGELITGDYPLPLQGGPQAQGSAITYARRYVLCAVTGVAPEDDDGRAAQAASQPRPAKSSAAGASGEGSPAAVELHTGALDRVEELLAQLPDIDPDVWRANAAKGAAAAKAVISQLERQAAA